MAIRLGPAQPRGMVWNGAGGWLIFSHDRQVNFSRTVWITFHWRGMTSSVSVTSSPKAARPKHSAFKAYEPGYIHIDLKYLPQMADESRRRYLKWSGKIGQCAKMYPT